MTGSSGGWNLFLRGNPGTTMTAMVRDTGSVMDVIRMRRQEDTSNSSNVLPAGRRSVFRGEKGGLRSPAPDAGTGLSRRHEVRSRDYLPGRENTQPQ